MTAWSLALKEITKHWNSTLEMLCLDCSLLWLLLVCGSFSFVSSKWKACSAELRSGACLGRWRKLHFLSFLQYVLRHYPSALWSTVLSVLQRLAESEQTVYTSEFIRILLSVMNTSESVPLAAICVHVTTLPPPCWTDDVVCFGSWAIPFLLHTFPILLVQVILSFICPKNLPPELGRQMFPDIVWPSCSLVLPVVCTLLYTLCT